MKRSPGVLVTRAAHQGSALAERLRAVGLEPVLIPAIEVVPPSSYAALDQAVAALDRYDWLLFSSVNGLPAWQQRMQARPLPHGLHVAAIGPATAAALSATGITVDLVPPQAVAESFAEALLPHARRPNGDSAQFLLVRAEEGRDHMPERLRAVGAEVTVAAAYRSVVPAGSVELLRAVFAEGTDSVGAITFTSSATARNLLSLCEAAGVALPASALRVSIGPVTSRTLRELGFPPHAEAPEASIEALTETVLRVLQTD